MPPGSAARKPTGIIQVNFRNALLSRGVSEKLDGMKILRLVRAAASAAPLIARLWVAATLAALLPATPASAQQYQISTVAGSGPSNYAWYGDGLPATEAQLNFPLRLAFDNQGNLYIADFYNYVVRQVANTGIINTFLGTGTAGYNGDNGSAVTTSTTSANGTVTTNISSAEIGLVYGLATDASRNVYVADPNNRRVRRVTAGGLLTTFAGDGTAGYTGDGGPATAAELITPYGLAVDSSGNVYISDIGTYTVRKVDGKTGLITTIAGTGSPSYSGDGGPASSAAIGIPYSVAFDPQGNLYISDILNQNIREVTNGNIRTVVSGVSAVSIAIDASGNIYYPNPLNSTVVKILPSGTQVTIAGNGTAGYSGDSGAAGFAQLNTPNGVALDASGNVYVADSKNNVIRELTVVSGTPGLGALVNAASNQNNQAAPGEIVVIYGYGIGPSTLTLNQPGSNGYYGTLVAGTSVQINGNNAPMIYASANQVAAIVPFEVIPNTVVPVTLTYQGQQTPASNLQIVPASPAVFTANGTGSGQAAAINQNGTPNSSSNPATLGSYVSLYITGAGQTSPGGVDGQPAPTSLSSIPVPILPVSVTVGGQPAVVSYAGGAPGLVSGLTQVNIQIPTSLQVPANGVASFPVVVQVGTASSPATATLAVTAQ